MEFTWYLLALFVAAGLAPFLYRAIGDKAGWLLSLIPFGGLAWAIQSFPQISKGEFIRESFAWFPQLGINLSFHIDGLSMFMLILISGIGGFVLLYAQGYLYGKKTTGRFFCYLLLFMGAMLGVVTADNLIALFVFWEMTSISSYLLIGFYNESYESRRKALQALLVTGLGGVSLLGGFILIGTIYNSWELSEILQSDLVLYEHPWFLGVFVCIILGTFTKSAQFPFHFWLPNAMAAPAPVSSFLHSATMVKAGVFLLAKLHPMLGGNPVWMYTLISCGAITFLLNVVNGLKQTDIKKILAYTTLSVLGILVMLLGIGTDLAIKSMIVFLLGHALYKATLFMCAGAVDHESGIRDVRKLSGLRSVMPVTAIAAGLAALSMSGIPPFFGFIGKEYLYKSGYYLENYAWLILAISVLGNVMMMALALKVGFHIFWGKKSEHLEKAHVHEAPLSMLLGPISLAGLGIILGLFSHGFVSYFVAPAVASTAGYPIDVHLSLWHGFNVPLLLSGITVALGLSLYAMRKKIWQRLSDEESTISFDHYFQVGFAQFLAFTKWQTKTLQSGYLHRYLLIILSGAAALLIYQFSKFGGVSHTIDFSDASVFDWAITVLIFGSLGIIITARSQITALIALGLVGFSVAMVFITNGAPDLAITQILVETLTVVLLMFVLYRLPRFRKLSSNPTKIFDAIFSICIGTLFTMLVLQAQNIEFAPSISAGYGEWSYLLAKGKNVVNVILVDFRALDTLGEIAVITIAGIGIFTLIKGTASRNENDK